MNQGVTPEVTGGQSDEDPIGKTCDSNKNCSDSTFCCSAGKCVHGSICFYGQKYLKDVCDYNFECLTRCCSPRAHNCSKFVECVQQCDTNSDCNTGCCSLGYCSAPTLCTTGNKQDEDYCDTDSECFNKRCHNHMCN